MALVRRRRDRIQIVLDDRERHAIRSIVDALEPELAPVGSGGPPVYSRPEDADEFLRLIGPEIEAARAADLQVVREALAAGEDIALLTEPQGFAWLRAFNHLRLAAGRVVGADRDGWEAQASDEMRDSEAFRALIVLGWLQEELVSVLET